MIKAVLFDMGGVVVTDIEKERYRNLLKFSKLNLKDVKRLVKSIEHKLDKGLISADTSWELVAKVLKIGDYEKVKEVYTYTKRKQKQNKKVIRIARHLKKKGYKVGIISNTNIYDATINRKIGYYDLFSPLILSHEVGCRKPEKKIYRIALKKLKVKPSECIFIDDKKSKLPPKSLGMKTILFKNSRQLEKDLRKLGVL